VMPRRKAGCQTQNAHDHRVEVIMLPSRAVRSRPGTQVATGFFRSAAHTTAGVSAPSPPARVQNAMTIKLRPIKPRPSAPSRRAYATSVTSPKTAQTPWPPRMSSKLDAKLEDGRDRSGAEGTAAVPDATVEVLIGLLSSPGQTRLAFVDTLRSRNKGVGAHESRGGSWQQFRTLRLYSDSCYSSANVA
jgi:hypothetical protein